MRLNGKVAIVTGASSGIGESIALLFAQEGARVVAADITPAGEQTVSSIKSGGGDAVFVKTDVSKGTDVQQLIEQTLAKYNQLDILVNCAGVLGKEVKFEDIEESEWDRIFFVNVKGMYLTIKYSLPVMKKKGHGIIINIASSIANHPAPFHAAYTSSKGAVMALTRAVAVEAAPQIRANFINPAAVDTPMMNGFAPEAREKIFSSVPLGRAVKPGDIARAALFLASDESEMLTGTNINVDGGLAI